MKLSLTLFLLPLICQSASGSSITPSKDNDILKQGGTTAGAGRKLSALQDLKKASGVRHPSGKKAEESRELFSTSRCRLGDIEGDLEEEFDFYSRAGEKASDVDCGRATDTCTTTIYTFLDDTGTNFTVNEVDSFCSTCTFKYPVVDTCEFEQCTPTPEFFADPYAKYCENSEDHYSRSGKTVRSNTTVGLDTYLEVCEEDEAAVSCFNIFCGDEIPCLPTGGEDIEMDTNVTDDFLASPEQVEVCRQVGRTDSFATIEQQYYQYGQLYYGCQAENLKRTFTSKYLQGVTNFQETVLTVGEVSGEGDTEGYFDTCEFEIDGVKCNSCVVCGQEEIGLLGVDCTNILDNATTSCDSFLDFFYGVEVERKFFVLQEGYVHPTPAPSAMPTYAPYIFSAAVPTMGVSGYSWMVSAAIALLVSSLI